MSALFFDLFGRGVTPGSTITKLVVTIEESADKHEWPSVEPGSATIQACPIDQFWPDSDGAEKWDERPPFTEGSCETGKRNTKTDPATWTFNLTSMASTWGQDPLVANQGVMLLGDLKDADEDTSWQVNLKIPSRDDDATEESEYNKTKKRVVVQLAFVPGDPLTPTGGEGFDTGGSSSFGSGSFGPSTSFGSSGSSGFGPGSGGTTTDTATEEVAAESAPATAPVAAPPIPKLPPYVWALLPLGLAALAAVRSVVLEPVGGVRPDGVIAAIRRRNAERRGGPLRELSDPLARFVRAAGHGIGVARRGWQGFAPRVSILFRSVRRR